MSRMAPAHPTPPAPRFTRPTREFLAQWTFILSVPRGQPHRWLMTVSSTATCALRTSRSSPIALALSGLRRPWGFRKSVGHAWIRATANTWALSDDQQLPTAAMPTWWRPPMSVLPPVLCALHLEEVPDVAQSEPEEVQDKLGGKRNYVRPQQEIRA